MSLPVCRILWNYLPKFFGILWNSLGKEFRKNFEEFLGTGWADGWKAVSRPAFPPRARRCVRGPVGAPCRGRRLSGPARVGAEPANRPSSREAGQKTFQPTDRSAVPPRRAGGPGMFWGLASKRPHADRHAKQPRPVQTRSSQPQGRPDSRSASPPRAQGAGAPGKPQAEPRVAPTNS